MFDLIRVIANNRELYRELYREMENSGESGDDNPLGSTSFLGGGTVATSYIGVQSDMEGRLAFFPRKNRGKMSTSRYTLIWILLNIISILDPLFF